MLKVEENIATHPSPDFVHQSFFKQRVKTLKHVKTERSKIFLNCFVHTWIYYWKKNTSDKAYLTFSIFIYVVKDVSLSKKICAFLFFSSCFFLGICFWYFHFFFKPSPMYFLFLYCASVLFRWLTPPLIIVLAKNFSSVTGKRQKKTKRDNPSTNTLDMRKIISHCQQNVNQQQKI